MHHTIFRRDSRISTLLKAASAVVLAICIVIFPKQAFEASLQGLRIWWEIVFPAMLPFLILAEILIGYGFMHFFGVLLEPIIRATFRLPGAGGWAISMGAAAGYVAGVQTATRLREQNGVTRSEGERLLAFAYICSPVFIISVVAAGFFQNIHIGWPLVIIHYASWLAMGLTFRWLLKHTGPSDISTEEKTSGGGLRRAIKAMKDAHQQDGRGFGQMLGDAVTQSVQTMMMVGGFMMMFSVLLAILKLTEFLNIVTSFISLSLAVFGITSVAVDSMMIGLFELHLGSFAASKSMLPAQWQAAITSAILAWGGLSIHAQVKGIAHRTDLSIKIYIYARLFQSIYAFFLALWWWEPLLHIFGQSLPSQSLYAGFATGEPMTTSIWPLWNLSFLWFIGMVCMMLLGSFLLRAIHIIKRHH